MKQRVSVIMSVHNGEKYLDEAVQSILNQTFRDFEFIIIDDGSTDSTPTILNTYADSRILRITNEQNLGLSASLNKGIAAAHGHYVARMDADDISLPERLARQVSFMDANPDISVCGTWAEIIGETGGSIWAYPTEHDAIHARMVFENTLVHASVMFHLLQFGRNGFQYNEDVRYAQDYELWSRVLPHMRFANLPEPLLKHRIHPNCVGMLYAEKQHETRFLVFRRFLSRFEFDFNETDLLLHERLGAYQGQPTPASLQAARQWLEKLAWANLRLGLIARDVLKIELGRRWTEMCKIMKAPPFQIAMHILQSPLPFKGAQGIWKAVRALTFLIEKLTVKVTK